MRWIALSSALLGLGALLLSGALVREALLYPARSKTTIQTLERLAAEISANGRRTGRLPGDRTELANQLGHKLPVNAWRRPIDYKAQSATEFRLSNTSPYPHWDIFEYDSTKSQQAVLVTPF